MLALALAALLALAPAFSPSEEASRALSRHPEASAGKEVGMAQGLHGGFGEVTDVMEPLVFCHVLAVLCLGIRVAVAIVVAGVPAPSWLGVVIVVVAGVVVPAGGVA